MKSRMVAETEEGSDVTQVSKKKKCCLEFMSGLSRLNQTFHIFCTRIYLKGLEYLLVKWIFDFVVTFNLV